MQQLLNLIQNNPQAKEKASQLDTFEIDFPQQPSIQDKVFHSLYLDIIEPCDECRDEKNKKMHCKLKTCQTIKKRIKNLLDQIMIELFQTQQYHKLLKELNSQKMQKGVCGKILTSKDLGFKCLDCEDDPTCIICQSCYEKSDHKGHRVIPQQGCAGSCDCGDSEAWNPKGFCTDHKGFIEVPTEINLPQQFQERFLSIYASVFYYFFQLCEQQFKKEIMPNQLISLIFGAIMQSLFNVGIQENLNLTMLAHKLFYQEIGYQYFHNCENNQKMEFKKEKSECTCKIIDGILRFNLCFNAKTSKTLNNLIIAMFSIYEFKEKFIVSYCKGINFFFNNNQNKSEEENISELIHLNVQLFTSEELAILAMQSPYFTNFFERFQFCIIESKHDNTCYTQMYFLMQHIKYVCEKKRSATRFIYQKNLVELLFQCAQKMEYEPKFEKINQHIGHDEINQQQSMYIEIEIKLLSIFKNLFQCLISNEEMNDNNPDERFQELFKYCISEVSIFNKRKDQDQLIQTYGSMSIPMHRIFTLLFLSKFDTQEKQSNEFVPYLKQFFSDENQFQQFILSTIQIPLRVIGFIKEIERQIWVYYGNKTAIYPMMYFKSKYHMFALDVTLTRILLQYPIGVPKDNVFIQFSKTLIFCLNTNYKNVQENQIQYEKYVNDENQLKTLLLLEDFVNFIIYLPQLADINYANAVQYQQQNLPQSEEIINNFFRDFLYQYNSISLKNFKNKVQEKLLYQKLQPENYIKNVAVFDQNNKQFKLKQNLESDVIIDFFSYFNDTTQSSEYFEKIKEKFQNQKKEIDLILGNILDQPQKMSKFAINILKQVFINSHGVILSILFNVQIFKNFHNLIRSSIRLLTEYLFLFDQDLPDLQPLEDFKKLAFSKEFDEMLENLAKHDKQFEKSTQAIRSKLIQLQNKTNENTDQIIEEKSTQHLEKQQENYEMEKQKSSKHSNIEIAQRKEMMRQKFLNKQKKFSQKNENIIQQMEKDLKNHENEATCVICKENLGNDNLCGTNAYLSKTNLIAELKNNQEKIKKGVYQLISCKHQMHNKCYKIYRGKKNTSHYNQSNPFEYNCPLCNMLSNIFIVNNSFSLSPKIYEKKTKKDDSNNILDYILHENQQEQQNIDGEKDEIMQLEAQKQENIQEKEKDEIIQEEIQTKQDEYQEIIHEKEVDTTLQLAKSILKKQKQLQELYETSDIVEVTEFFDEILKLDITLNQNSDQILTLTEDIFINLIEQVDTIGIVEILSKRIEIQNNVFGKFMLMVKVFQSIDKQKHIQQRLQHLKNISQLFNSDKIDMTGEHETLDQLFSKTIVFSSCYIYNPNELMNCLRKIFKMFAWTTIHLEILDLVHNKNIKEIMGMIQLIIIFKGVQLVFERNINSEELKDLFQQQTIQEIKLNKLPEEIILQLLSITQKLFCFFNVIQPLQNYQILRDMNPITQLMYLMNEIGVSLEDLQEYIDQNGVLYNNYIKQIFSTSSTQIPEEKEEKYIYPFKEPKKQFQLIELPENYSALTMAYMNKKCSLCNDFSKVGMTSICLICGIVLCSQQCKQLSQHDVGNLNTHAMIKHSGQSVFLLLKSGKIVWVASPKNQLDNPIYHDQYGQDFNEKCNNWDQYLLDKKVIEKTHDVLIQGTISQEIEILKLKHGKQYYESIF